MFETGNDADMSISLDGGCLCGDIRFRIHATRLALVFCHCGQCRKAQGAGFAANVPVERDNFEWLLGKEKLKFFQSSKDKRRYFCANCGSPLMSYRRGAEAYRIRAGALDSTYAIVPQAHIFFPSRASWITVADTLPKYDGVEPGRK